MRVRVTSIPAGAALGEVHPHAVWEMHGTVGDQIAATPFFASVHQVAAEGGHDLVIPSAGDEDVVFPVADEAIIECRSVDAFYVGDPMEAYERVGAFPSLGGLGDRRRPLARPDP